MDAVSKTETNDLTIYIIIFIICFSSIIIIIIWSCFSSIVSFLIISDENNEGENNEDAAASAAAEVARIATCNSEGVPWGATEGAWSEWVNRCPEAAAAAR